MSDRSPAPGVRVALGGSAGSGPVDGAWWPRSRDLASEAARLVEHLALSGDDVRSLLFSRPDWDAVEGTDRWHRVVTAGGTVRMGSYASDDTHLMVVTLASGQRLRLVVVPHDTDSVRAQVVLDAASAGANLQSPGSLLGLSGPDQSEIGHDIWDGEHHGPHRL
ncbi:DUF5994 family protein [Nocardioides zeicaulis]|uniref:DUF5994 family protein n=1 Tax=Nocardioides zeicaulis TaxID=1776857 RepID=A0ABV6E4B4_9ACTN